MAFAPELRTHAQKVCTLYKKAMRNLEAYYCDRYFGIRRMVTRYHQVLLRKQFDDNRSVCDPKEQRRLLWVGEHELFMQKHPLQCAKFAKSAGIAGGRGPAFERVSTPPDWVLDYWHPLEKAQYPEYFKKREERKRQYLEKWHCGILY